MTPIAFSKCYRMCVLIAMVIAPSVHAITLQEAFNNALKLDPTLRSSRFNQEANNENIIIARSRLLPQISVQGSTNQLTQTTTQDIPGNASISRSFTGPSVNHQFVIRQGLVRPKDLSILNFTELQMQYGEVKYQSEVSELWLRVASAWIDLLGARQLVEAYAKPLEILKVAAKQEDARFKHGDGTKDALVEAEAQFQLANAVHQQALQIFKGKQKAFELLVQVDSKLLEGLKLNLRPKVIFSETDRELLWQLTKEKSFELRLSELQQLLQREKIRMARADHMPTLDVLAAWNIAKNDATSTQGYQYKNNQIGIQYTVPIYSGGSISATERQAALTLEASIAESEAVYNKLESDFRQLWSTWVGQSVRIQAGYQLMESSIEQLKATQLSYAHGVKSVMDLANAELALSRRVADQINAVIDFQKYTVRLNRNDLNLDN